MIKIATKSHTIILTLVMVVTLLSACANTSNSDTAKPAFEPRSLVERQERYSHGSILSEDTIRKLFHESRKLVSDHTGADLEHIQLVFASDEQISEEVEVETRRLIDSQFTNSSFASHFLSSVMSSQSGTYAALFATKRQQVMLSSELLSHYMSSVADEVATQQAAVQALLIHELVHAADDVTYSIHENRTLNFRASFAQSATFEGHAQWMTRRICAEVACTTGLNALDSFMFGRGTSTNQLPQSVQAVSRNVLEYSYVEGERFLRNIAARPDGKRLIKKLLSNPPKDPIQILNPASYPDIKREQRNQQLLKATADVDHHWREQPWTMVETSPLKGVNLRADPGKRRAAVDGFTRLITSMVAAQLYNQDAPEQPPIELTLMQTDRKNTAVLFAETLHNNAVSDFADTARYTAAIDELPDTPKVSLVLTTDRLEDDKVYYSAVASLDTFVIQTSGLGGEANDYVDFSIDALTNIYQRKAQSNL
jgi:hypothetical protein